MSAKIPTPQAISALLRKAGFGRAVSRLLHGGVSGYSVSRYCTDAVQVRYSSITMGTSDEYRLVQLARYARVISLHGYATETDTRICRLIVTAKTES